MDREPSDEPSGGSAVEIILIPRSGDLGNELRVHRALPSRQRRMVGPFIFFDQMGPALLKAGQGMDVRPHPHIGLATNTYLFSGEILHRDSLGFSQSIRPGAVNWMTAGRGIVHSERTPPELRPVDAPLSGIQTWIALPRDAEEIEPAFDHHPAAELPVLEGEGRRIRVITGSLFGARAPVRTYTETFYADVELDRGASLALPQEHEERAMYIFEGSIELDGGDRFGVGRLVVFRPGAPVRLRATDAPARLVILGGEPMDGPRHIWWNYVSSSRERIEQAKSDWREGRFPSIPGETGFIPLPGDDTPAPVNYP